MAKTKITLSIEEDLIIKIKHKAIDEKKSVSSIAEDLIKKYVKTN